MLQSIADTVCSSVTNKAGRKILKNDLSLLPGN